MFSEKLAALRTSKKMTQEQLAEKLDVTRQSVQKWESGASFPSIDKLVAIADLYSVSLDGLCREETGEDYGRTGKYYIPDYENAHDWEFYFRVLFIEYMQCADEGKDVEKYKSLFDAIVDMPSDEYKKKIADVIFELVGSLPQRSDYPYIEPNDLESIKRLSDGAKTLPVNPALVADKIAGGWFGRVCGCFLGKPVECIRKAELDTVLKRTNNFPLSRYIDADDFTDETFEGIKFQLKHRLYPRSFGRMPVDDDTDYTIMGYEILRRYGRDFTSANVGEAWLKLQTMDAYCTAERIAYKNLIDGYRPPASGEYKNVFREWIGAEIRADFYGYINPGDPATAANMAYRDARISHVKNGVYGAMWSAAAIASAFSLSSPREIVENALGVVPKSSRLYEGVKDVIAAFDGGMGANECIDMIHSRYDETKSHGWTHVIPNVMIVTAALLYGGCDYGKTVCLAVGAGFDTDCNGATSGSIAGVMLGKRAMPGEWTGRIADTLESTLEGYSSVSVAEMAKKTLEFLPDDIKKKI